VLCLILKAIATFLCDVGGGSNISGSFVDTTYKVEYKEKIKIINKEKIKIEKRYDTLFMYFLDSPYSTKLLDSTINIHRFIARELNLIYQKRIATDSTLIELQDSLISDLEFVICEIDQEQKSLKKYSLYATIYSIIVTLFLCKTL
jgi:hypothetical protein